MDDLSTSIPVGIHLATHTVQDGEASDYVLDVEGQIVQIGETIYLRYREPQEDNQGEPVPVTIKFLPNGDVSLTRNGENRLRMHFSAGKRIRATYRTPYGIVPVETVTPQLRVGFHERPFGGEAAIDYQLYVGQQLLGNYEIRLQFTV
ncbi:DUF1934 domain-containing protein [Secundilactobacillus similis]|jgi:uncharacterized beta-barrel protein YwiB (DUF1934 family)|uniref:DUF1934 domain-containing protein n=1 Tax=Secundilactobacillus similis DSM 23365 = JCM 2765 TaxID=1423804 RepID=A0A0R2EXZ7_9LACO|nr:DUF1934 domain-containing protein [Secundilactobacillus similis]KRN21296.1 hypothetical protein FD14_GL001163 [Secundilactobacillus similis DSM 23365 = JCM 2765]